MKAYGVYSGCIFEGGGTPRYLCNKDKSYQTLHQNVRR